MRRRHHLLTTLAILASGLGLALPAQAITRCEVIAGAQSWVDNQVPYSWGPGASHCPGPLYCDPLRENTCYRSDCSGLVSAAWGLAGPGHTSYSFAGGPWDDGVSYLIPAEQLEPGDALNFPGDPGGGTGHVMLYVSGTWAPGSEVEVIEESGCGKVAMRHNRAYNAKFLPMRYVNIEPCNSQGSKKDKLVSQVTGNGALSFVNWSATGTWPSEGHPELFVLRGTGELAHLYATGTNDDWSPPLLLGPGATCGFAAGYWPSPKSYPEVFVPTQGGTIQHAWLSGVQWNAFQDFEGKGFTQLSTLTWPEGRLEVFALGPDRAIWHRWWDNSTVYWSAWTSLGGEFASGAAPIQWLDGHAEIFATDPSGTPWHNWYGASYASGWHGWEKLQGSLLSRPIPVRWSDGHLDVFARGMDGQLVRTAYLNNTWSPFVVESAGVQIQGEPSVAMNPEGAGTPEGPEVVARGVDGQVLHLWWDGSRYRKFEPLLSRVSGSDPFAWLRDDGTLQVFAITPSGELVYTHRSSEKVWGAWTSLGMGYQSCSYTIDPDKGMEGMTCQARSGRTSTGWSVGVMLGLGLMSLSIRLRFFHRTRRRREKTC